jgi:hypothetical protein
MVLANCLAAGALLTALPAYAMNRNVSSYGDLADAIRQSVNGDTITFTKDITLTGKLPDVDVGVTINGGNFTLNGDDKYRGLFIGSSETPGTRITVAINDLKIINARAQGGKGDSGGQNGGPGGGGAGLGGALFITGDADVTVRNVSLQGNSARGGNGGFNSAYVDTLVNGGGGGMFGDALFGIGGPGGGGDAAPFNGASGGFGGGGGGMALWGAGSNGQAGFGGGNGQHQFGGGGAGMGGAIFVQEEGELAFAGALGILISPSIITPRSASRGAVNSPNAVTTTPSRAVLTGGFKSKRD